MTLSKIAWRSIQQRSLASFLTGLSMALGVSLVVAVLVIGQIVAKSFASGNALGYNVIVGAKGGRLDLLLNTVYYLNRPIENIPWDYYQQFLRAKDRSDHKDGKYADDVDLAIPVCLGDVVGENGQYRVVGTTPELFSQLLHATFSSGENFKTPDFTTAVVGAEVAKHMGFKVGDSFSPAHGVGGEKHMPFKITGILDRTSTPVDRAAFVNMEGFFLIPDHARGHVEEVHKPGEKEEPDEILKTPLPEDQREVTAVLIRTASIGGAPPELVAPDLVKHVNKEFVAQAIEPIKEITVLTITFVQPMQWILLALTVLIVIVAGIGILVSIYNSMSERRHEIAVMRALGAHRGKIMLIVLTESIMLALGGGLAGWLVGHLLVGAAAPTITEYTGVAVNFLQFVPTAELILIPGLIVLASLVGYLPALSAYRTDVARALTAAP
ncbi:MAG TPA: FtsX-like permease family protein [Pirellulales bacterium]|jgi:putative ABC transport system permease protein|nr:FtsX-like permease family protein [Pirellulales bacterium]